MGNLSETNYKLRIEKLERQNSLLIEKIKNFRNEIRNWDIYESYDCTSKEEIYGNFNDYFKEELK
tara:strand:+ start:6287 stop:6481 length:195 start_codon:yes stop_codon:yes gene_type:complete